MDGWMGGWMMLMVIIIIALSNCWKVPSTKHLCFRPACRLIFCVADGCSCAMAAISITNTSNEQIAFKV